MPQRPEIDEAAMSGRIRDYGLNTLSQVASLTMGSVFGTAALAFADILRTPDDQIIRLTSWFVGVLISSLSLIRILHASLIHSTPSPYHLPLILCWGFLSTINFALVAAATGGPDGWRTAYLLSAALSGIAMLLTWIGTGAARVEDFSVRLRPAIARYIQHSRATGRLGCMGIAAGFIGYPIAWHAKAFPEPWVMVLMGTHVFGMTVISYRMFREVEAFRGLIDAVHQARDASES